VHGLDLRGRVGALLERDPRGATFLDCVLDPGEAAALTGAGALVLDGGGAGVPLHVDRTTLYTADELYDATPYRASLDARAYAWSQRADGTLPGAVHDHAIDVALNAWVRGRRVVGVMGGHAADRGTPSYDDAARLGHALGRHLTVATGGGPGAMEAANLGGRLATADETTLREVLRRVAVTTSYRPSVDAWVAGARAALAVPHEPQASLGVPTWHYGHEPPNLFATAIAKYVRNAIREAVLLQVCSAGIVFLPGAAGTVQEVFEDACENYYADESAVAPMVLLGASYWTGTLPAWPLLQALARGTVMEQHVHLVDRIDEAVALLV
jgi:predicted Rossmann-fold nucleotide-binding protein